VSDENIIQVVILFLLLTLAGGFFALRAEAQEAPRCGNNGCYCYIDPYSKSTVCRKYP